MDVPQSRAGNRIVFSKLSDKELSKQMWRWLWQHMRQDKYLLVRAMFCSVGMSLTSLAVIGFVTEAVGAMENHNSNLLNLCCLGVVGSYVLRWGFSYGQTVDFAECGQRLGLRLRQEIYQHLQGLSLSYFNRQRTGALMSTMTNDVPILQSSIAGLKDAATSPVTIVGAILAMVHFSKQLTLAALLVAPLMAWTINRLNKQIKQMTTRTQDKISDVTTMMEETLSGIRVIQSFSAEEHEITRFYEENHAAKELSMRSVRRQAQLKPWIDVIGAVGIAFALWTAGHLIVSNHLTVMSMLGFIGYVNQVSVGINNWGGVKSTWEQMKAAAERINENVLSVEAEIQERPGAVDLGEVQGRIEFRNVSFAYNHDNPVLQNVSFTMEPGQVVAVVGASGAGKSTLADLIPRFYDPNSGTVLVDGHDIRDVKLASLRAHIGIVPQETVLFGGSIRDNIAYGDPGATREMVEAAARAANAHQFVEDELSDGYETLVGERGKQLSGGQRQRISIARALLKDPRILILDEATSSLDTRSEVLVQKALDELMKGRTTLVIAHRLSTIMNADKILVMQSGRVLESGTHRELLARGGAYAKLYETQYRWEAEERPTPAVAS